MKTVYKYPFYVADAIRIPMPGGAIITGVALQEGRPHLWALVDTSRPVVEHRFRIFGTGHEIPEAIFSRLLTDERWTFQQRPFVWHLFREMTGPDEQSREGR